MTPFAANVLKATGYLSKDDAPSEGLVLPGVDHLSPGDAGRLAPLLSEHRGGLGADAVFRVGTSVVILFKSVEGPNDSEAEWHRLAWNFGIAPLLWVTTPQYVRLYNAYQPPTEYGKQSPLLIEFPISSALDSALEEIKAVCGRQHVAMGSFWRSSLARRIDRRTRIDTVLLTELGHLLNELVRRRVRASLAQKLVGRCIFFQYLVHRGYVGKEEMRARFGASALHEILTNLDGTYALFRWIKKTFNGDLFPIEDEASERNQLGQDARLLAPLADFFGHFSVADGQGRLFPFRFDAIPVELISSIYEKFVHMSEIDGAPRRGVHYTPINLVDLVLDPVFEGLSPDAHVLDPACGSGVFLVESLRRLVWLRSRVSPLTREMIRDTLLNQVRGIDISPAALSVATFSLYLALLELDPRPPSGLDALDYLRFDPLRNHVLFSTSTFNPALKERIAAADADRRTVFDAIVGNPPWTYSAAEKDEDRALARRTSAEADDDDADSEDEDGTSEEEIPSHSNEDPERRSGTTYARLAKLPIPPRSMDWAFLWRCREFRHGRTRIALVMKATPFFSLDPKTSAGRDAILREFPHVGLVNLSQLRTSRLFQEYEDSEDSGRRKKRTAGPALLFFSNCLPTEEGTVTGVNFPWTSSFVRTGVFELPAEPAKVVSLEAAKAEPALLKATLFGTDRDAWFLERLFRSPYVVPLAEWSKELKLPMGQGYQKGTTMPSAHLLGLPKVAARDLRHARLPKQLPVFDDKFVHRARESDIFRGPLVLLPEGRLTAAPAQGRYTAAFDSRDLAYNESFVGVSFHGHSGRLARAFAAVMHSALIAYQLALFGGTVGIKQTKVEAVDLDNLRILHIDRLHADDLVALASAADILASDDDQRVIRTALVTVDRLVAQAARLTDADRELLSDVDRRARAILFETEQARRPMETPPTSSEINTYSHNLCSAFNAFAAEEEDLILIPDRYTRLEDDLVAVKFALVRRADFGRLAIDFKQGSIEELVV